MNAEKDYFKDALRLFIKDIQSFLTVIYLVAVGVGMLYNSTKYSKFGINIFEYANVFDFLLAPFEDITIIGYTLVSFSVPTALLLLDLLARKYPKRLGFFAMRRGFRKRRLMRKNEKSVVIAIFYATYLVASALTYGKDAKKKTLAKEPVEITFSDGEQQKGILIGKTDDVIFLYEDKKVKIIPLQHAIKVITLP